MKVFHAIIFIMLDMFYLSVSPFFKQVECKKLNLGKKMCKLEASIPLQLKPNRRLKNKVIQICSLPVKRNLKCSNNFRRGNSRKVKGHRRITPLILSNAIFAKDTECVYQQLRYYNFEIDCFGEIVKRLRREALQQGNKHLLRVSGIALVQGKKLKAFSAVASQVLK